MKKETNFKNKSLKSMTIGERMRYLRKKNGYSVNDLTIALKYKENESYYRLERDDRMPSIEKFELLSKLYNVSIDFLYFGNEVATGERSPDEVELLATYRKLSQRDKEIAKDQVAIFDKIDG